MGGRLGREKKYNIHIHLQYLYLCMHGCAYKVFVCLYYVFQPISE